MHLRRHHRRLNKLGIEAEFKNGLRVTDGECRWRS